MTKEMLKKVQRELRRKALDFAIKVQPIYELLKWKWHMEDDCMKIPTTADINDTLHDLISSLDNLTNSKGKVKPGSVGLGGFEIEIIEGDHSLEAIMSFSLEEYIDINELL